MGECCRGGWQEPVEQALDGALQVFIVDCGCFMGGFWSVDDGKGYWIDPGTWDGFLEVVVTMELC